MAADSLPSRWEYATINSIDIDFLGLRSLQVEARIAVKLPKMWRPEAAIELVAVEQKVRATGGTPRPAVPLKGPTCPSNGMPSIIFQPPIT